MEFPVTKDTTMNNKSKKKKPSSSSSQSLEDSSKRCSSRKGQKPNPKKIRSPLNDGEDSSSIGNEYRTLRRKYLLLEEESFGLGRELEEVENEVKALEHEKSSLLDQLVVLEGLVDPSDL